MYNVSQDYITALKKPFHIRRMTGTIGSVSFTEDNIAQGSFILEHQCSEGNVVKIGSVYMAQLSCTFRNIDLTGQWQKKVITLSEGLLLGYDDHDQEIWEDVPLGVYTIYEANHTDQGVVVTAYDNMKKLDKKFKLATTNGTPYDFLVMIKTDCKIQLAQTEEQIRALNNGTKAYVLNTENDVETYRDLLSWVAQTVGAFATFNRNGALELRQYKSTSDAVDTITANDRWGGASFSDFETYYTGVSVTKIEDETTVYVGLDEDDGLTYNLGANPLLQSGNIKGSLQEILNAIRNINYTPFSLQRGGCPAYDLGDVIEFEDGNGDGKFGCLMSFGYTFHGAYSMEGFGSNPALLDARSKTDKDLTGLMKKESMSGAIQYYTFTNASPYTIRDSYKEIIFIRFGSMKDTIVIFHAEIKLNSTSLSEPSEGEIAKVIGNIKYIWNNVEMEYHPKETWIEGDHLLHLLYYFNVQGSELNTLSVRMNTDGEVVIQRSDIQASVHGQGLVATTAWDGYIELEDVIHHATFMVEPDSVAEFVHDMQLRLIPVTRLSFTEQMHPATIKREIRDVDPYDSAPYLNKDAIKSGHRKWGGDGSPTSVIRLGTWENVKADYGW